jgi:hypothetical protein
VPLVHESVVHWMSAEQEEPAELEQTLWKQLPVEQSALDPTIFVSFHSRN